MSSLLILLKWEFRLKKNVFILSLVFNNFLMDSFLMNSVWVEKLSVPLELFTNEKFDSLFIRIKELGWLISVTYFFESNFSPFEFFSYFWTVLEFHLLPNLFDCFRSEFLVVVIFSFYSLSRSFIFDTNY